MLEAQGTFLEQMAISAEAATDYMIRYQDFRLFVKKKAYNIDTPKSLDSSFSFYLNHLFFEGADVSEGFKVLAAVLDAHPDCGGKLGLCQSRRCLQGWAKIDPARTRPPLPFPVVAMLAVHMIDFGCPEAALAILLTFSCYLRPSEMLSIRGVDLVAPTKTHPYVALNLHPEERLETSKMNMSNESILPDSPVLPTLGMSLMKLAKVKKENTGLFTTSKDVGKSSCDESPPQKLRSALSTSTCRSITRQASQVEKCPGSKTQRKVAIRQQCETLRTTCPCPKGDGKVAQESQRCSGESSRYPGAEGFKVFSPLKPVAKEPVWIVEVFAGCSRLSKSFANLGFHVLAVDIEFGESNDLLQEKVQNKLLAFIKTHKVVYVWLGTPCTSWSRARKNDGGPQPLRNDDSCLFGFENLGPADAEKVRVGNALLAVSLRLIEFCISARIIWTLENPWTSRIWLTPGILALQQLNTPLVQMIRVDYCQYQMPWRKSTALLSGGFPALHNVSKVCQTKHGRCSASGRPHIILQGRDHTGMFFTLRAQPYPPRMCVAIAACFLEQFLRLDKGQISM